VSIHLHNSAVNRLWLIPCDSNAELAKSLFRDTTFGPDVDEGSQDIGFILGQIFGAVTSYMPILKITKIEAELSEVFQVRLTSSRDLHSC
jgi:hypothetical protein